MKEADVQSGSLGGMKCMPLNGEIPINKYNDLCNVRTTEGHQDLTSGKQTYREIDLGLQGITKEQRTEPLRVQPGAKPT